MSKTILITGASSGIGYECAQKFAQGAYRLIIAARRKERITQLAHDLHKKYGTEVYPLVMDVQNRQQVHESIASLPANWQAIDVLINNAGLALGLSTLDQGDMDDWDQMIDTNIKGLLYVSKAVIPGMIERKQGQIINIGSIAGRETYVKGNVYCATKYAVKSLSEAMRKELVEHNIRVSLVSPGATDTEFSQVRFKGDQETARKVYDGYRPLSGEDIAHVIHFCAELPAHVNINDMLVMPAAQASAGIIHRKNP